MSSALRASCGSCRTSSPTSGARRPPSLGFLFASCCAAYAPARHGRRVLRDVSELGPGSIRGYRFPDLVAYLVWTAAIYKCLSDERTLDLAEQIFDGYITKYLVMPISFFTLLSGRFLQFTRSSWSLRPASGSRARCWCPRTGPTRRARSPSRRRSCCCCSARPVTCSFTSSCAASRSGSTWSGACSRCSASSRCSSPARSCRWR